MCTAELWKGIYVPKTRTHQSVSCTAHMTTITRLSGGGRSNAAIRTCSGFHFSPELEPVCAHIQCQRTNEVVHILPSSNYPHATVRQIAAEYNRWRFRNRHMTPYCGEISSTVEAPVSQTPPFCSSVLERDYADCHYRSRIVVNSG